MEAIFSGTVCLCVFRGLAGLPLVSIWNIGADKLPDSTYITVLKGGLLGLIGAGIAACFAQVHTKCTMKLFRSAGLLHNNKAVPRALAGATAIVILGVLIPRTMFWGEEGTLYLKTKAALTLQNFLNLVTICSHIFSYNTRISNIGYWCSCI